MDSCEHPWKQIEVSITGMSAVARVRVGSAINNRELFLSIGPFYN